VNIRPKFILVVLPLVIAPLAMAALVSYLSARNGISAVASDFLRFKSRTLMDYMDGQWDLLSENKLQDDPEYITAAQEAISAFAENLATSPTEIIFAVDSSGSVVMSTRDDLDPPNLEVMPEAGAWVDALELGGLRRVAYVDAFAPWDWTVFASEAWDSFYRPVLRIALFIGVIAAVSLTISLVFLIMATGVVVKPLEGMVQTIEQIIETMDLKTRVPVLFQDETGRLARSFNKMTAGLDRANEDIKNFALRAVFAHRQAVLARKDAEEAKEREQNLRVLFQKYVPQSVIDQNISRTGQDLRVGESQFVSVMMTDIRDFTTITEKMPPAQLVDSLNRYFEAMVDVIDHHGGITDKYIGDAIMALFGAPEKKDDDVYRSVLAGLAMLEALDDFNADQHRRGIAPFTIGVGIHYGVVTAGNIGSDKKMDYTVIGETVNMASRLEGLTKYYGTPMIVSETVRRRIQDKIEARLLDRVMVKGSSLPMPIYSVSTELNPDARRLWEAFAAGQAAYYDRDFPGAEKRFRDALKVYPDDKPTQIFLERTIGYIQKPPDDDWDGAFRHETK